MSSFPPSKWQVRYLADFDAMLGTPIEDREISLEALMAIWPAEGNEGAFRFILAGANHIKLRLHVSDILPEECFEDMYIELQVELGTQIKMERNSVCSKWEDLTLLVQSQDVEVTDSNGTIVSEEFLEAMEEYKKTANKEKSGIVLRWLLGTWENDMDVNLIAQLLPCSIDVIEANPALKSDHTRGMMAGKFKVDYNCFNNKTAAGNQLV